MRWQNRGNEFSAAYEIICNKNSNFYLWGAGDGCCEFIERFSNRINILGIFDANKEKQGQSLRNIPILPLENLENSKVIITTSDYYKEIPEYLEKKGLKLNRDYFFKKDFEAIYKLYKEKKLEIDWMNLIVTDKCSLKCKDCIMLSPYFIEPKNQLMENLKADVDLTFTIFDSIKSYQIVGGEPLIYPQIEEIIEYIGAKYRQSIDDFLITTNGTVVPEKSFFELCKDYNISIRISDYGKSKKFFEKQKIREWLILLDKYKIEYELFGTGIWHDFGNPKNGCIHAKQEQLLELYQNCNCVHSTIRDGKWFTCCRQAAAVWSNLIKENKYDYYNLKEKELNKKELLEYYLKFCTKGWLSCCEVCFGDGTIMMNREVDAAEQLD